MPAAAVIPAPIAYIKVVAVKKLVVGSRPAGDPVRRTTRASTGPPRPSLRTPVPSIELAGTRGAAPRPSACRRGSAATGLPGGGPSRRGSRPRDPDRLLRRNQSVQGRRRITAVERISMG